MRWFRDLSIRRKLMLIITVTASVSLLLACLCFLVYDRKTFEESVATELGNLARVQGPNFTAALVFDYKSDAENVLAALREDPSIVSACVYSARGELFASYLRAESSGACPERPAPDGARFQADRLVLLHPLLDKEGRRIGSLYLESDLRRLKARFAADVLILAIVMLAAVVLAFLVASRLERLVSAPILDLADTAKLVSENKDYSLRVAREQRDEVGDLVRAFNDMLARIELRDGELRSAAAELKRSHVALEDYSRTLELRVHERTAEIAAAQKEAEIARDQALSAARTKSTFLANMSHELRTPLNSVIGFSSILKRELESVGQTDFVPDLDKIAAAGKHLLALIDEVLDLSKLEAGKLELSLETFSIPALVGDVAGTIQPLRAKQRVELSVDCNPELGSMHANPTKLRQILLNLVGNACKFSPDGHVWLRVAGAPGAERQGVKFEVIDDGIGMTRGHIARIFDAFSQAESSVGRVYGGTGLGLAISRAYSRMMGGDISVTSELDEGSTFVLWLPIEVSASAAPATGGTGPAVSKGG